MAIDDQYIATFFSSYFATMKTLTYRLLRLAIILMGIAYTAIFLTQFIWTKPAKRMPFENWVLLVRGTILMTIGLIIALKLPRANEHIFFAFFLVNFALTSWIFLFKPFWALDAMSWALTAGSFVYAMIKYPGATAHKLYAEYLAAKRGIYKRPVLFFTGDKKFWLIFFPALILLRALGYIYSDILSDALNIIVNISGLIYFRISYSLAGKTDRSRLAWILWGLITALVITLIELLIRVFYPEASPVFFQITFAVTSGTISIAIIMGVFFAGFLDSGLVLRGTIVYSVMFLAVIFTFSVIEHYIEHSLSLMLGIESDLISSFLAGFLALAVQPIHKRLEHILPKF